jgi:oligo-1,6-glucosidase
MLRHGSGGQSGPSSSRLTLLTIGRHLKERQKETGQTNPDMSDIMAGIRLKARDHARSPVQWDDTEHAGFTSGKPWMRVNDDYKEWNDKAQRSDRGSVWNFWKRALAFRKAHPACVSRGLCFPMA